MSRATRPSSGARSSSPRAASCATPSSPRRRGITRIPRISSGPYELAMSRGDVLHRILQELRLGEVTAIVRHFGFRADGDKEARTVRLRDRVLDGDIPFRDVLRSAYVWQLGRMCQVAGLSSEG